MSRKNLFIFLLVAAAALVLGACQPAGEADCSSDDVLCVGLVTDVGEVDDKSFNQSSWEGVLQAQQELGVEAKAIETVDTKDYAQNIGQFISEGYDVIVAHRGAKAVDLARARPVDLVLCDLGLPDGMTGFDVARLLKSEPNTRRLRLVAVTGYGRPEDKLRAEEAGFDAHVTKPIALEALKRLFAELKTEA